MARPGCLRLLLLACVALQVRGQEQEPMDGTLNPKCDLPTQLRQIIRCFQPQVNRIIEFVTNGEFKGVAYRNLSNLVDAFGPRMTGTKALEDAIDSLIEIGKAESLDNVYTEDVLAPNWRRYKENAWLLQPRRKHLHILGLGGSICTPPGGLVRQVLVVRSFEELEAQKDKVRGKIVVFNPLWYGYESTVIYRREGATRASEYGAVGALIRSMTPFSIYSPHTGQQDYPPGVRQIPVASITVEDADMMQRMQDRGDFIKVKLEMGAYTSPQPATTRNSVFELRGSKEPNQTVIVSAHIDSWDVGDGAMDDGGGSLISLAVPLVLKKLGLRPRRTVRTVLFTAQEQGLFGSNEYFRRHKSESKDIQLMLETDSGTFSPKGIGFSGVPYSYCILKEIMKLMHPINATQVHVPMLEGPDIDVWQAALGVQTGSLLNDNEKYFWFHHSYGDTMTVMQSDAMDRCLALWTSLAYVVAELGQRLPQGKMVPNPRADSIH